MKKFVFRYEGILKLRKDREDQIKQELAVLFSEREKIAARLSEVEIRTAEFHRRIETSFQADGARFPLDAIEPGRRYYRECKAELEDRIAESDREIERAQQRLSEAVKERKAMEKLKENRRREYVDALNRLDEKMIEEIVNYNNSKGERHGG